MRSRVPVPSGCVVKVKRLPATGSKSLGISQRPISSAVVSAFHTFSGGWGSTSSTTMSRVAALFAPCPGFLARLVIVHLLQHAPEVGEALTPEDAVEIG